MLASFRAGPAPHLIFSKASCAMLFVLALALATITWRIEQFKLDLKVDKQVYPTVLVTLLGIIKYYLQTSGDH